MTKYSFETDEKKIATPSLENTVHALTVGYAAMARAMDKLNPDFSARLMETLDNAFKMNEGLTSHEAIRYLAIVTKAAVTKPE